MVSGHSGAHRADDSQIKSSGKCSHRLTRRKTCLTKFRDRFCYLSGSELNALSHCPYSYFHRLEGIILQVSRHTPAHDRFCPSHGLLKFGTRFNRRTNSPRQGVSCGSSEYRRAGVHTNAGFHTLKCCTHGGSQLSANLNVLISSYVSCGTLCKRFLLFS